MPAATHAQEPQERQMPAATHAQEPLHYCLIHAGIPDARLDEPLPPGGVPGGLKELVAEIPGGLPED